MLSLAARHAMRLVARNRAGGSLRTRNKSLCPAAAAAASIAFLFSLGWAYQPVLRPYLFQSPSAVSCDGLVVVHIMSCGDTPPTTAAGALANCGGRTFVATSGPCSAGTPDAVIVAGDGVDLLASAARLCRGDDAQAGRQHNCVMHLHVEELYASLQLWLLSASSIDRPAIVVDLPQSTVALRSAEVAIADALLFSDAVLAPSVARAADLLLDERLQCSLMPHMRIFVTDAGHSRVPGPAAAAVRARWISFYNRALALRHSTRVRLSALSTLLHYECSRPQATSFAWSSNLLEGTGSRGLGANRLHAPGPSAWRAQSPGAFSVAWSLAREGLTADVSPMLVTVLAGDTRHRPFVFQTYDVDATHTLNGAAELSANWAFYVLASAQVAPFNLLGTEGEDKHAAAVQPLQTGDTMDDGRCAAACVGVCVCLTLRFIDGRETHHVVQAWLPTPGEAVTWSRVEATGLSLNSAPVRIELAVALRSNETRAIAVDAAQLRVRYTPLVVDPLDV